MSQSEASIQVTWSLSTNKMPVMGTTELEPAVTNKLNWKKENIFALSQKIDQWAKWENHFPHFYCCVFPIFHPLHIFMIIFSLQYLNEISSLLGPWLQREILSAFPLKYIYIYAFRLKHKLSTPNVVHINLLWMSESQKQRKVIFEINSRRSLFSMTQLARIFHFCVNWVKGFQC